MVRYILFGLIALGVIGWMGMGPFAGFFASSGGQVAPAPAAVAVQPVSQVACDPSDGLNNVKVVARNILNSSLDYQGNSLVWTENGIIVDTGTANSGGSLSYKTLNAKCSSRTGIVYAMGSSTENGAISTVTFNPADTTLEVTMSGAENGNLTKTLYSTSFANTSTPADAGDWNPDITESAATTMAQDSQRSGYIKMTEANGSAAFGGAGNPSDVDLKDAGILVGVDTVNSAVFSDNDIPMYQQSGLSANFREIACSKFPMETAKLSLNKCYVMKAIGSKTDTTLNTIGGDIWLGWNMRASLGNPGATDDPVIYLVPLDWFQDTDNTIHYGAVDKGSNFKGRVPQRATFDNS